MSIGGTKGQSNRHPNGVDREAEKSDPVLFSVDNNHSEPAGV